MSVDGAFGGGPLALPAVGGPGRLVALRAVTDLLTLLDTAATPDQLRTAQGEARAALGTAYARGLIDATTLRLSLARVDAVLPGPTRAVPTAPPSPTPADTVELSSPRLSGGTPADPATSRTPLTSATPSQRPVSQQPVSPPLSTQPGPHPGVVVPGEVVATSDPTDATGRPPDPGAPPRPATAATTPATPAPSTAAPGAAPAIPFDPDPLLTLATLPLRTPTSWSGPEVETWSRHVLPIAEEHVDAARSVAVAVGARGEQQTAAATAHQLLSWSLAAPLAPGLVPLRRHEEELYAALAAGLPGAIAGALAQQSSTPQPPVLAAGVAKGIWPSLLLLACAALVLLLAGWLVS